jgi:hypothetical protein
VEKSEIRNACFLKQGTEELSDDKRDMSKQQQRLMLTLVAVYSAATLLASSAPILLFASSTAAYADNGNGWPKTCKVQA